jgi:uncharacterized repeat protein (TIGR04138 family)
LCGVNSRGQVDWPLVRARAAVFPEEAFDFVREGLKQTSQVLHGPASASGETAICDRRHVSGQQLCMGLRELAMQRWGLLAQCVLRKWGIRRTEDFGTIVYALIDREELRASDRDSIDDFAGVYDFDEVFGAATIK